MRFPYPAITLLALAFASGCGSSKSDVPASASEPFDMHVRIATTLLAGDGPQGKACSFQNTNLRFNLIREAQFQLQDGQGNLLAKASIGAPTADGQLCVYTATIPAVAAATAYQVDVPLRGLVASNDEPDFVQKFTASEARSEVVDVVLPTTG